MASSSSSRSRRRDSSRTEASSRTLPSRPNSPIPSSSITRPKSSPSHSPPLAPLHKSRPRDPNAPPRDPYYEPDSALRPKTIDYQRVADKRLKVEAKRSNFIIYGFDLRPKAAKILESKAIEPFREFIQDFIELPNRKKYIKRKIFKSFSYNYPASFSLKLAKFLLLHPPLHIRNEVVYLLRKVLTKTRNDRRIACPILVELKTPILESFKIELEDVVVDQLSKTIGDLNSRINDFPLGGWIELHEYIVSCVSLDSNDDDSVLKQRKGLMLLADLSCNVAQMRQFWNIHYSAVYNNLKARMLDETTNKNFHALTFDALLTMMGMARNLGEIEIGCSIFSMLFDNIGRHWNDALVLRRVHDLGDFVFTGVGKFINGKEKKVFQSMLGIAEKKDTSEELRCAAIQVIKNIGEENEDIMLPVIKELSYDESQMALKLSMDMLLCIEDDPLWFEFDEEDSITAGLSESFKLGKFLLNWLLCQGDGSIVVPIAFELLKTRYAASKNWRKHHAKMIVIAALADGQKDEVAKRFVEIEKLVFNSLNGHHRVIWAAVNAMRILSEHNLIPNAKYHRNFISKLFSIVKCNHFPNVQVEAVIAIRSLVANCRLFDKIAPFWDEIFMLMLELLKNDKQKIQEEAVETLKSVVVLIPINFQKYYDTTVESLKAILFDGYRVPNKCLHAKSLEFMSSFLLRNEFVNFKKEDAVEVIESFKELIRKLSKTDYLLRKHMLQALGQFCRFTGANIDRYINKLMPMLLQSAQLDIDLKGNMNTSDSKLIENERVEALKVLSQCAAQSQIFSHHLHKVSNIFENWLSCSRPETRMASVSGLPKILLSVKSDEKDEMVGSTLQNSLVQSLVEALHKETDDTVHRNMLNILSKCIEISGSVFIPELIRKVVDEIVHILSMWSHIESKRASETSEEGSEYLPDEEIIQSVRFLIMSAAETFEGQLLPYVDNLFSTVAQLWGNDLPDRMKEIAVSIFNIIVPYFPDKLQMYHDIYTFELLKEREGSTNSQWESALGIGICAEFGGQNFKTVIDAAISRLYYIRLFESDETEDGASISDMAVLSLWKIYEFHRENINNPKVIGSLLNFLPLKNDLDAARYVHAQLCKMLRRNDADILGPNKENLPQILYIFSIILFWNERLATEETFSEITQFVDKHNDGLL